MFSEHIAQKVCDRIASGESLRQICRDPEMPDRQTIRNWQIENAEFSTNIARAREAQQDVFADKILEIAESATEDDWQARKFLVNTMQWHMSKLAPKKYGDKQVHTGSEGDGPVEVVIKRVGI
jgi:hypothetical protein